MQKRVAQRFKRRLQLRFWSLEDKTPRSGFTQDVSVTGMFICTNSPISSGARIAIEVSLGGEKIQLLGEVRHARRVDPVLRMVKTAGMGVRLLKVEEVMSEVLRLKRAVEEEVEEDELAAETTEETDEELAVFPVYYDSPHDLANTFSRDIKHGGLFVATPEPAERDERVMLEFLFDWDPSHSLRVEAQVVKKFVAAEGSSTGEQVTGMGVAFSQPAEVIAQFGEIVAGLNKA
jgi:Tfp pilus assembly protein PilZ